MNGSGNDTMYYVLSDHLGSMTTIVNAATSEVENYSFTAWGMPRDASDWTQSASSDLFAGRGYTGYEHLSEFSLINMNGRVYDPILGRFYSPDPYVQAPRYPNNYNRYSYVLNNPLRFTDPSGYYNKPSPGERERINERGITSNGFWNPTRPQFQSYWDDYYASQSWSYNWAISIHCCSLNIPLYSRHEYHNNLH